MYCYNWNCYKLYECKQADISPDVKKEQYTTDGLFKTEHVQFSWIR